MDESQNDYAEYNKLEKTAYHMIPFISNYRGYKLLYSDRKQKSGYLVIGKGQKGGITSGMRKLLGWQICSLS